MSKCVVYPYKMQSGSAKMLAKELNTVRVSPDGKFRNNYKRTIVNWGNSETPTWWNQWPNQNVLNHYDAVKIATNKVLSFQKFKEHGVEHPEWTTDRMYAVDKWMANNLPFLVRTTLVGKGGEGIYYIPAGTDALEDLYGKLYTLYFKKKHEYRVHVFDGKVIDFQEKKRERDNGDIDSKVRNHANGWVFCRSDVVLPDCVKVEAIKAVSSLGLTFGAVDVGYNVHYNRPCVFEVNTAPGLTETTAKSYAAAIKEFINKENV